MKTPGQRPYPMFMPSFHSQAQRSIAGTRKAPFTVLDTRRVSDMAICHMFPGKPLLQRYLGNLGGRRQG